MMLKAKIRIAGREDVLYVLGLSTENLKRLKDDQPIVFDISEMEIKEPGRFVIVWGETEQAIVHQLNAHGVEVPPF